MDEAIRLLRLKLPQAESNSSELTSLLSEAFTALLQGGRHRIEGCHVRAWPGLPRESSDTAEEKTAPMGAENALEEEHLDAGSTAEQKEPTPSSNDTADSDSDVIWIPPPCVAEAKLTLREALGDGDSSSSNEETEPTGTLAAECSQYHQLLHQGWTARKTKLVTPRERRRPSANAPSSRRRPLRRLRRIHISLVNIVTPKRTAPSYLIRFFCAAVLCRRPTVCRRCHRIAARGVGPRHPSPADVPGTRAPLLRFFSAAVPCRRPTVCRSCHRIAAHGEGPRQPPPEDVPE
ncbi:uncharacterized protein PITG_04445 [Phytophthora infestans T30-4]|uniref:Uncharacterized protein n=1 Tax=Phytophthora infestans (strain T30-4) TaxID=403677 RepID=D0N1A0_PHYIT|nr:uncharacterized protein PITG_04445 [Phytophthora infestans T30-4]EEY67413.1 conserved hypothetical protein [Phytophthora infestans T30-4]|eukprot:XP_002906061.1 conserved hypothetical protein [Phytophthora infestans T30-4]